MNKHRQLFLLRLGKISLILHGVAPCYFSQFDYGSHKSQIKFLQHLTTFARQRIVINCKNTAIIFDNEGNNYDKAISLASFDEENMSVHSKMPFRYRVMEDGCKVRNKQIRSWKNISQQRPASLLSVLLSVLLRRS